MSPIKKAGFAEPAGCSSTKQITLDYMNLKGLYDSTPGLVSDKLKRVLETVGARDATGKSGIIFAYDEAQNLSDHAAKDQYPLSLL